MEMPKPTDAHRNLERLVGEWKGEERIHPSPWDPKGGVAVGRISNRLAVDGFVVVQDYEQERGGQVNFRGHGIFGWNAQEGYTLYWFDSMGMPPNIFRGKFEDNVLTMINKESHGQSRATWDFNSNGEYTFRMELSQDGTQWQTLMEGNYTRR